MKTLANCNPREFLRQTNKIRKLAATWLTNTKILDIRRHKPVLPDGISAEERKAAIREQARRNISDMLDNILDKYPDDTAELLGLVCFIEPEDLDSVPMTSLLASITEIINNKEVLDFFASLMQLDRRNSSGTAKA